MSAGHAPLLVMHVIHRLAVGGLENGLVNLINRLPPERFRHAIVCLTDATDFARRIERPDVDIVQMHKRSGNSLAIHSRFHRLFRQARPTIVHTRNLGSLEAQVGAWAARVPIRVHGEHGWDTGDLDGSSRRFALIRRMHAPLVHRHVALSSHIAAYLERAVGIPPARIERICNGVDCERFAPSATARRVFPHPPFRADGLVLVGTVGRLEPVKDQLTLVRAFVAALTRNPEARRFLRLVVVGSGSMRPAIEAELAGNGVSELAWLAGERSDVAALLPALDVFVLPSLAEGISNTILEAMACGVPVVATAVGGNPELVVAGETGELVPAGDVDRLARAVLDLAVDQSRRRRVGIAARARALTDFSLSEMVRRYARLYEREVERHAPRVEARLAATRATD